MTALSLLSAAGCRSDTSLVNVRPVPVVAARLGADARQLVVSYRGGLGDCGLLARASASETAAEVVVAVSVGDKRGERGCDDLGVLRDVAVQLRDPLDARRLVDAMSRKPLEVRR